MKRKTWLWIVLFVLVYAFVLSKAWPHPETKLLPIYVIASLSRLIVTYLLCLIFGLSVGIFAAMNKKAGEIIIPLLDILQSVPVLGFFPFAIILLVPIFGFATASVVLLFTSMAWSVVFGVIAGVKSIPQHIQDMAAIFNLRGWAYIKHIVLPSVYPPLIAGSILAFGGGWYFLIASEYVSYGATTYALPGLGYYLNVASFVYADVWMSLAGLFTIGVIVLLFHKFVWVKLDRNAREAKFLNLHFGYDSGYDMNTAVKTSSMHAHKRVHFNRRHAHQWFFNIFKFKKSTYVLLISIAVLLGGGFIMMSDERLVLDTWGIISLVSTSFFRIICAYIVAVAAAISIGYLLIRKPKSKRFIMPAADVLQSIPALAYFPILFLLLTAFLPIQLSMEIASVILLLTGMLWYLLFNVIEAVEHLPRDINEIADLYDIEGKSYIKDILIPAMFPALVTGSILAFGGGWNAIIVSEYVNLGGTVHSIPGIGSALNVAAASGKTSTLLILLGVMTLFVLLLNHFVWRRLLNRASKYVLEED